MARRCLGGKRTTSGGGGLALVVALAGHFGRVAAPRPRRLAGGAGVTVGFAKEVFALI